MKKINKKALLASLALTFGAAQASPCGDMKLNTLFNLREIGFQNFLAHIDVNGDGKIDAGDGSCPGHARAAATKQAEYEAKKAKKKKKKPVEDTMKETTYSYQVDEEEE